MEGVAGALRFELSSISESWKQKVMDMAITKVWVYRNVFCWKTKKSENVSLFYPPKKTQMILTYGLILN